MNVLHVVTILWFGVCARGVCVCAFVRLCVCVCVRGEDGSHDALVVVGGALVWHHVCFPRCVLHACSRDCLAKHQPLLATPMALHRHTHALSLIQLAVVRVVVLVHGTQLVPYICRGPSKTANESAKVFQGTRTLATLPCYTATFLFYPFLIFSLLAGRSCSSSSPQPAQPRPLFRRMCAGLPACLPAC